MNKVEVIARRILGWKLARWDRWFDYEKGIYIENFNPEQNRDHAMMIVDRMKELGFSYEVKSENEVCFGEVCERGETFEKAITNAAFSIADNRSIDDEWL